MSVQENSFKNWKSPLQLTFQHVCVQHIQNRWVCLTIFKPWQISSLSQYQLMCNWKFVPNITITRMSGVIFIVTILPCLWTPGWFMNDQKVLILFMCFSFMRKCHCRLGGKGAIYHYVECKSSFIHCTSFWHELVYKLRTKNCKSNY